MKKGVVMSRRIKLKENKIVGKKNITKEKSYQFKEGNKQVSRLKALEQRKICHQV